MANFLAGSAGNTPGFPAVIGSTCAWLSFAVMPLADRLPELEHLERALDAGRKWMQVRWHAAAGEPSLPVYEIHLGNPDPALPALGVFAGVHGLERIGAQVAIAWLHSLAMRLPWDDTLHEQLRNMRLICMPLVNPGGAWRGTRCNPHGVDLMRNAPVEAQGRAAPLVGGQRVSSRLPWYRGAAGEPMQPEGAALCEAVERELHGRPFALALDLHSGFGLRDRIWFPPAHRHEPVAQLGALHALCANFESSHPHHPYLIEPQSRHYLAHGDLWDHLCLRSSQHPGTVFLPLTLEMGSWLWVKKNPRQLLSWQGLFNPLVGHRRERVLRRHLPLLDFAMRASVAWARWLPQGVAEGEHARRGRARWYGGLA